MCECIEDTIIFSKKHMGKFGTGLGILGVITSALIGSHFIVASAVVLGITNLGIIIGSLAYEQLQNQYDAVEHDNKSLQNEVRRFTTFQFPTSQSQETPTTESSIESNQTEPFEQVFPVPAFPLNR